MVRLCSFRRFFERTMGNVLNSVNGPARIVIIAPLSGEASLSELIHLPKEAKIVAQGTSFDQLQALDNREEWSTCNILFNVSGNSKSLPDIINSMPYLRWIHSITAGLDHIICPEIMNNKEIVLTNAKGVYSSSLAEYSMGICLYFNKQIPRLLKNQQARKWDQFIMNELRGKTLGIVGYGDIGRSCAKLAKTFGMKIICLRRRPELSRNDPLVDKVVGNDRLIEIMAESDYVISALALVPDTVHFIGKKELLKSKKGQVLINIGRGMSIDQAALIEVLKMENSPLLGCALDVFEKEPLPVDSELWQLPNVIISPHNADMTADFRHQSVRFFCENVDHFMNNRELQNVVDKELKY